MVSLMKTTVVTFLLLLAVGFPAPCGAWTDPGATQDETAVYRIVRDGNVLPERKEVRLEVGENEYLFSFLVINGGARSSYRTVFTRGGRFRPLCCSRRKTDSSGSLVVTGEILLRDNPAYTPNTCPLFGNFFALRSLCGLPTGSRVGYSCLFPGGSAFPLTVKTLGHEQIRTPVGTFTCVKLEESLDLKKLIGGLFGFFLKHAPIRIAPKTLYWFDREPPHVLVMRKGVAGPPPNDFTVVDELVHYE
jgi:hypothetical protein